MQDNDPSNGRVPFLDFYGIEEPDNWMHSAYALRKHPPDKGIPTHIQYFRAMSEAMARSCSGEVVVISQTPADMGRYGNPNDPNIWWQKEKPALEALIQRGVINRMLVADYNNLDDIWNFDLKTSTRGSKVAPGSLNSKRSLNESEEVKAIRRALCETSSGMPQRLSQGDQFSDPYQLFDVELQDDPSMT